MHVRKISLAVALALTTLSASAVQPQPTTTVKIIAINDFHGNLNSPGNFNGKPSGGVDALAGYVADLKSKNPHSVVVSAGDMIGATPLVSALFHDEGTIETMNRLGLDFNAVGNHEFDEGRSELMRMQHGGCHPTDANSCQGAVVGTPVPFEGARFKFLAANVVDTATGDTVFPGYKVKKFRAEKEHEHDEDEHEKGEHEDDEVRVAFIGMTLKETPSIVTPAGVAGLQFKDEAATVNALVPKLRKRGVEAVVVLIHQGGAQTTPPSPPDINGCVGGLNGSPIRNIVAQLDDEVDLVISGHTHQAYNCLLPNKAGRNIPVTSANAFGRVLTDIDMTIDSNSGEVVSVSASNVVVDRSNPAITPSASIKSIVDQYNTLVSPIAGQVIGSITMDATNVSNASGEMDAGALIADAQLAATAPAQFGGAQIAFMNAGGVRSPGFVFNQISAGEAAGDVTYGEAFTVQPFGNSLVTMTLTGQQIKDVLEQQFPGCMGQSRQRIMQVSNGFSYAWSESAPACGKISNMRLNGAAIDPAAGYRVTVNNFMATGGDGFGVLVNGTNQLGGAQDIDALVAYMAGFKSPNAPYSPVDASLHKPRITKLP